MTQVRIASYDVSTDTFTIAACDEFDTFTVPGLVLPALIGEYGEPDELVGKVFTVALP